MNKIKIKKLSKKKFEIKLIKKLFNILKYKNRVKIKTNKLKLKRVVKVIFNGKWMCA